MSGDMTINVELGLDLTTEVSWRYRQVSEDDYATEPTVLGDAIIEAAARQLVEKLATDKDRWRSWQTTVHERMLAAIDARIEPILDEAFTRPIPRTNAFGERVGSGNDTTLTELVVSEAHAMLRRTNNRGHDQTPLDKALAQASRAAVEGELAEAIAAAKAEVVDTMRQAAAAALAAQLAKAQGLA